MRWKRFSTEKEKCYCGKGYRLDIMYTDDCYNIKFDCYTDCKECSNKYREYVLVNDIDKCYKEAISNE